MVKGKDTNGATDRGLDRLLDEREAADILNYSIRALQNWRYRGGGPRFVKVSARSVRYRLSDLERWIEARTVASTSEQSKPGIR